MLLKYMAAIWSVVRVDFAYVGKRKESPIPASLST